MKNMKITVYGLVLFLGPMLAQARLGYDLRPVRRAPTPQDPVPIDISGSSMPPQPPAPTSSIQLPGVVLPGFSLPESTLKTLTSSTASATGTSTTLATTRTSLIASVTEEPTTRPGTSASTHKPISQPVAPPPTGWLYEGYFIAHTYGETKKILDEAGEFIKAKLTKYEDEEMCRVGSLHWGVPPLLINRKNRIGVRLVNKGLSDGEKQDPARYDEKAGDWLINCNQAMRLADDLIQAIKCGQGVKWHNDRMGLPPSPTRNGNFDGLYQRNSLWPGCRIFAITYHRDFPNQQIYITVEDDMGDVGPRPSPSIQIEVDFEKETGDLSDSRCKK